MLDPISWAHSWPYILLGVLFGYVCGSIPTGLILNKFFGQGDLRSVGSGNIGATNVLRTGRKDLAALTLLGDMGKGLIAVLLAYRYFGPDIAVCAGLGAFLGHLFPIWIKFKGGKGVATFLGVVLGLAWPSALVFAAVWLSCAFITRYSSLSALIATIATTAYTYLFGDVQFAQLLTLLTILLWAMHHKNIRNLLSGSEGKIGQKG